MEVIKGLLGLSIGLILLVVGIYLTIYLLFLGTLSGALKTVDPQRRTMNPGNVYWMLVPIFNIIWCFIVVSNIAESLGAEFAARGVTNKEKPTYNIGIAYAIFGALSLILPFLFIGAIFLLPLIGFAGFVCFIAYWVSVSNNKTQLESAITLSGQNSGSRVNYSANIPGTASNQNQNTGYSGGYSGGHNNNNNNNYGNNVTGNNSSQSHNEYKSGDLYK